MPSGENPWTQLLASNRRKSKGDLNKLQIKLWHAISVAEAGLRAAMEGADGEEVRRWLHIMYQLAGTYGRIALDGDIETRLKRMEQGLQEEGKSHAGSYSPA